MFMSFCRRLSMLLLLTATAVVPALVAHAAPTRYGSTILAFVRADNVWVARADGTGARAMTRDGTGTRIVNGRQVTYAYLAWPQAGRRLMVGRFESSNPVGGTYHQGWSIETWTPGSTRLVTVTQNVNSQDFIPQWSRDGRTISYIGQSAYNDKTLTFQNTVRTVNLSGRAATLTRFRAREGCLDSSTDPSELTFWSLVGPGGIRQTFLWSSANRFLVYSTECIHTGLRFRSLVSGAERVVGPSMTEAVLSPGDHRLAGVDGGHVVVSNVDGTARRIFAATVAARLPVWSPDGRFVYYLARKTLETLRYHARDGNLFEIQVNRALIDRLDVGSGLIRTILTLPVHAFANLTVSRDGRWLYCTQVPNSDQLYRHLVHSPNVTNALLTRYGPRTTIIRVPSDGGSPRVLAKESGVVALSGA
ncbi:MAG: hypothetical protein NVS2B16_20800 [Chloroflexota bacterium]